MFGIVLIIYFFKSFLYISNFKTSKVALLQFRAGDFMT